MAGAIYAKPLLCPNCHSGFGPNEAGRKANIYCPFCEHYEAGRHKLRAAECAHLNRFSLYKRKPRSDGGGFDPFAYGCPDCDALFPRVEPQASG